MGAAIGSRSKQPVDPHVHVCCASTSPPCASFCRMSQRDSRSHRTQEPDPHTASTSPSRFPLEPEPAATTVLERPFPVPVGPRPSGLAIAGFVFWQGHKDQNAAHASRYEQNLEVGDALGRAMAEMLRGTNNATGRIMAAPAPGRG